MKLNPKRKNIDDFVFEDFILERYQSYPPLKAEIANIGGFTENKKKSSRVVKKK